MFQYNTLEKHTTRGLQPLLGSHSAPLYSETVLGSTMSLGQWSLPPSPDSTNPLPLSPKAPNLHLSLTTLNFLHITVIVVQPLSDHFVTSWTVACQTSMGFSRQEYWSGLPFPFPGDLPNPGIEPSWAGRFFITEPLGKPSCIFNQTQFLLSLDKKERLLLYSGVS